MLIGIHLKNKNVFKCMFLGDEITCDCAPSYTGTFCTEFKDFCFHETCYNGGECDHVGNRCVCTPNFTGKFCEFSVPKSARRLSWTISLDWICYSHICLLDCNKIKIEYHVIHEKCWNVLFAEVDDDIVERDEKNECCVVIWFKLVYLVFRSACIMEYYGIKLFCSDG